MNKQWQDDLRDRMELHEEPTPEGLWDNIEQLLHPANVPVMPPKRGIPLWAARSAAVAAVALVLLIIGIRLLNNDRGELHVVEQNHVAKQNHRDQSVTDPPPAVTETSPAVNEPTPAVTEETTKIELIAETEPIPAVNDPSLAITEPTSKTVPVAKTAPPLLASATKKSKTIAEKASLIGEEPMLAIAEKASPVEEAKVLVTEIPLAETEVLVVGDRSEGNLDENQQQHAVDDTRQPITGTNDATDFQRTTRGRNLRSSKWQTDLYASNTSSGTTSTHSGYGSFVPYELNPEEFVLASVEQSELPSDIRGSHEYQHVYTDIRHSQPVTLGVSVLYNLNERWSLTSGLTYTLLSSELYSGSKTDNHYHHSRQSLHYVGVPLNVNYTVWRNPKISTYVSGGGLVEKNLWGKLTTDFVIGDQIETRNRQDIRVKPLQWSVNSAVGIQYQATRHIGLYAEPGVTYHFKNSSEVETIYKERPLNFNIRLGLRFSFNE